MSTRNPSGLLSPIVVRAKSANSDLNPLTTEVTKILGGWIYVRERPALPANVAWPGAGATGTKTADNPNVSW